MLYLVGLGLSPKYMTLEARDVIEKVDRVFLDTYTVPLPSELWEEWEKAIGREVTRAEREVLESPLIPSMGKREDVAVAVVGDPLAATTHISLLLEAERRGARWRYVPGVSIITVAASLSGLQHYRFGLTVTVPRSWRSYPSFAERVRKNMSIDAHTLLLLEPGLTVREALEALAYYSIAERSSLVVVISRAGWEDCSVHVGSVEEVERIEVREPISLILPASLHPVEEEFLLRRRGRGACEEV